MFEPTVPFGEPELMRASTFLRYLHEPGGSGALAPQPDLGPSLHTSLSPSLLADLGRFEHAGQPSEVLEVLAACVRHAQDVMVHLHMGETVVPLTVFPRERMVHCEISPTQLLTQRPTELRVLHVEPAVMRPADDPLRDLVGDDGHYHPLGPMLWELALRGSRTTLLPEIAGPVAYRVSLGLDLGGLRASGAVPGAIQRLRQSAATLREMAEWPGFDLERASRLLNGLYLQAGLILSRTHPAAIQDSWFSSLRL